MIFKHGCYEMCAAVHSRWHRADKNSGCGER